jgi:ABC-type phosphate transport system substrate-binding protein
MVSPNPISIRHLAFLLMMAVSLALFPVLSRTAFAGGVTIVVHPGVPVDNLSLSELRRIFQGNRQYWSSNLPITLLFPDMTSLESKAFMNFIYHMDGAQFNRFWKAKVFRAEITVPPKLVFSDKDISETLMAIPGSIAFVDTSKIPRGVKALAIDGFRPEEEGYPLK